MRPPSESTFASLCVRDSRAVYRSLQSAARIPTTLFAAICSPSAAAEHDPSVRASFHDRASDRDADRRIVDRLLVVRPVIVDRVPELCERLFEMFLQREPCMIGPDRDAHTGDFTVRFCLSAKADASWSPLL